MKSQIVNLLCLLPVCLLTGCTGPSPTPAGVATAPEITRSPNDEREYRYRELENGLKVLLIADRKADKSAAALTVFRGSYDDPVERPGLAHFLEHMLFIGTEKYPEPDAYFKYVQAHGGSSNAYTSDDHTNYFFDVQPRAFREGLDRFAQFFIAPLFSKAYVEREKNAVNSEYQLQIKDDGWRSFAVQKVAANPDHPLSRFNIGTLETLGGDVHGALLDFFRQHYSSNQMSLVILSPEPLDELEPYVVSLFSNVRNRELKPMVRAGQVFPRNGIPATIRHDNIKEHYEVSYTFPIPATLPHFRKKPVQYVTNLIGHEGEGSLHKLLTDKGWISFLSASDVKLDDGTSALVVSIELTEQGAQHIPEINGYLFEYLALLRSSPVEEWLYGEQARVAELGFRFAEKMSAIRTVQSLAPGLAEYPVEDLLVAPYLMEEFDPRLIRRYIRELHQQNVLVSVSLPEYEGEQTERWFGVSYDLKPGPVEIAEVDGAALRLPEPNPFLPASLDLLEDDPAIPKIAVSDAGLEVYLDTDLEFRVPRAVTHLSLRNDKGFTTARDRANAYLYAMLVRDDLNALAYPAYLAGMSYELAGPPRGFRVTIGGYQDRQLLLLEEVIDRLVNLEIDPQRFEVLRQQLVRDLINSKLERPYLQSYQRLWDELLNTRWTADQLLEPVSGITPEALATWRDKLFEPVSVQALMTGNVNAANVEALQAMLQRHLTLADVEIAETVLAPLAGAGSITLSIEHDDASMVLYVQASDDSIEERARMALLQHLIAPGYFATLRTDQQLGYLVAATNTTLQETGGLSFIIQSPVAGPGVLRERTLNYMAGETQRLQDMPAGEFGANKGGLIARLTQRDKSLGQRAARHWSELDRDITTFDARQQLAKAVSELSREDMVAYLRQVNEKLDNRYLMIVSEGRFAAP